MLPRCSSISRCSGFAIIHAPPVSQGNYYRRDYTGFRSIQKQNFINSTGMPGATPRIIVNQIPTARELVDYSILPLLRSLASQEMLLFVAERRFDLRPVF